MNKMTKINKTIKKAKATLLMLLSIQTSLPLGGLGWALSSCSDFLYDDSDQVIYADDHSLSSDADTLWSMAGIMNKMQAVADRTILLGEVRGDLVSLTANAPADLRQLANFSLTSTPSPLTSTPSPLIDFREVINAKHPQADSDFQPQRYWQVFEGKHGFQANLSILDLLFNMGPESIFYL